MASQQHTVLTQATHLTAQTNTAYHKMGHLIGAAKRWDISAAYCAHTSNTSNSTTNTAYHKMGHQIRAAKRWGISAAYCAHTPNTDTATRMCSGSCQSKQEPSKRCPTDVPYSTLNGVGATNHNTLSPWHAQDTIVCFNWES